MFKMAYLDQLCTKQLLKLPKCFYFFIYLTQNIDILPQKSQKSESINQVPKSIYLLGAYNYFSFPCPRAEIQQLNFFIIYSGMQILSGIVACNYMWM